ncbi:NAD-dependent epimerase/dehydratase [gamma proteobacterium BDW918]|jgi:dihydroflavonol-4-reductase|uniref:Epimerase n=1 Tax=Zhongshania aliphaticivorans TaxID=1470434 RepID=A0A127M7D4_9GAMM|nr:NAD-dependent epimerase/dehydratase family protein [Zhongshania aliphaticivorans]AMO69130.1 epimerase [Zhongshania aliphaticivorans]EIF43827.1 NAD-dependent epimerase/dehydratase [gamma proteobacterium BDW918]
MKVLVVGGTGLIGGEIALYLQENGHAVTLMSRKPTTVPGLADMPFLQGDYINDDFSDGRLNGFDWLVFSAAADIRNIPQDGSVSPQDFYTKVNDEAVPRFFAAARDAGFSRAVMVGTFYPQVAPQQIGVCPYVTSRHNTDVAVRALSNEKFSVCSINAPFVLGNIPGMDVPYISALEQYARGNIPGLPVFAPKGGTNHISSRSLAQAALNALNKGEPGKGYLVGDENYSWKEYLELWFEAVGNPLELEVREDDHPMFPNVIMFAGAGATVSYEPAAEDMAVLSYDRHQIKALIKRIVTP